MQHTEKYQFNLIEGSDDFSPEPLNENMEAVETQLAALETDLASSNTLRNCQIYYKTYTGTGEKGPITHNFPHKPIYFAIQGRGGCWMQGIRGFNQCGGVTASSTTFSFTGLSWTDKGFVIGNSETSAANCCNTVNEKYALLALLDATD